jgi:hypothetical protein
VLVRSFCKNVEPDRFSLAEIQRAKPGRSRDDEDTITFNFGGLGQVNGLAVDASLVDLTSIVLSPHVKPLHAVVHRKDGDGAHDHDDSHVCREARDRGSVEAQVSRDELLNSLQLLQPQPPLQPGDQLRVILSARLSDGRPVSALFTVTVDGDRHHRDHYDVEQGKR